MYTFTGPLWFNEVSGLGVFVSNGCFFFFSPLGEASVFFYDSTTPAQKLSLNPLRFLTLFLEILE